SSFQEIRGVWLTNIDSDVLFKAESTENAIADLAKLKFNTLYPTVWNWGHTLYPSQIAKLHTGKLVDPTDGLQDRDLLQEIVKQGHQQKMTVIPWFEFGFMAPADSILAKNHPDWLTQKPDRETIWLEGKTHERVWLNPLNPEVQQFITDLVLEIVNQYDIDGIQFDDHFGYPADFGYDPLTLKLYQGEHSGKLPPNPTVLKPVEDCVVNDPEWQAWVDWRSQKITEYMAKLSGQIKAVKPQILVSVSPNPQRFSKNCFLLDWQSWQQQGLIDQLVLQVYRN
ncbi:MAG: family 10 glycosylhydrolase, partial [Snowella sp.]